LSPFSTPTLLPPPSLELALSPVSLHITFLEITHFYHLVLPGTCTRHNFFQPESWLEPFEQRMANLSPASCSVLLHPSRISSRTSQCVHQLRVRDGHRIPAARQGRRLHPSNPGQCLNEPRVCVPAPRLQTAQLPAAGVYCICRLMAGSKSGPASGRLGSSAINIHPRPPISTDNDRRTYNSFLSDCVVDHWP
jgi:hypothetical protein